MDRNRIGTVLVSDWHGIDVRSAQIGRELISYWHRIGIRLE